ncbi:phytoene/squalene synthase family protein [Serinibacter arcticus]|uniref:Phytoene synthase n=1 Tax=Serinibacter arcticus TaxID=1655435 RepID=A0A4Z1DWA3_9MICO|nr:phytoene/squalene synthase family protein [Serinibacter arcticus]TGO03865.1 Phytoene synthase [Serinibacter arcticus]
MTAAASPAEAEVNAAALARYTRVAQQSAARVIASYSTSFGVATRLLAPRCRTSIASVYALVRVADEVVDGVGSAAGLTLEEQLTALRALEAEVDGAVASGFSTNLVVHAFAVAARASGIDATQTRPFFASMEMDLDPRDLDPAEQEAYVYGSAEVVGLMCLQVFLAGRTPHADELEVMTASARALGAAFQNVNFLRDLADDAARGRGYLPGETAGREASASSATATPATVVDEATKRLWVDRVDTDVRIAKRGIALLPRDCRAGVAAACALFEELNRRIAATPADQLARRRISVPAPVKARLVAAVVLKEAPWRASS